MLAFRHYLSLCRFSCFLNGPKLKSILGGRTWCTRSMIEISEWFVVAAWNAVDRHFVKKTHKKDKRGFSHIIREILRGSSKTSEISCAEGQYPNSYSKKNRQSKFQCIETQKSFLLKILPKSWSKSKKRISIKNVVNNLIVLL